MTHDEKTYLVLMVQSSHRVFCYYNISSMTVRKFEDRYGEALWINSKSAIKVYSIENGVAVNINTIFIDPFADNWYIDIQKDNMDVFIKVGKFISSDKFIELAVSNIVTTPRDSRPFDNSPCFLNVSERYISSFNKEKEYKYPQLIFKDEELWDKFIDEYMEDLENKYSLTSSRGGLK